MTWLKSGHLREKEKRTNTSQVTISIRAASISTNLKAIKRVNNPRGR